MNENILREIFNEGAIPFIEWNEFSNYVRNAYTILIQTARRKHLITYYDLSQKINLPYNEWFPLKIGTIVGSCSCYENREGRPLISSIVVNSETNCPGNGYWGLPGIPPNLKCSSISPSFIDRTIWSPEQMVFWANEVNKVFDYWERN